LGPLVIGLVKTSTGGFRGGLLLVAAAMTGSGLLALLLRTGKPEVRPPVAEAERL